MELRIDELLEQKGDSQSDMALALGVKQSTVSKWVSGKNSPPTKKLEEIAAYFDVEPLLLFRKYALSPAKMQILSMLPDLSEARARNVGALVDDLIGRDSGS